MRGVGKKDRVGCGTSPKESAASTLILEGSMSNVSFPVQAVCCVVTSTVIAISLPTTVVHQRRC